ncbi:hypothetical protein ANMWB30_23090 [Arthrobacter sp. MWB30]|nr:hypothetical protein ANMWB30_23090 [Arthrobacter sp. MWB30]
MGLGGFPSGEEMSEMFGFVTPEDREQWARSRESNKQAVAGTARDMAHKSIAPALDMARHGVQAQMHGAQYEAQRGEQPKVRSRVIRQTVTEQSHNIDGAAGSDYGPDF